MDESLDDSIKLAVLGEGGVGKSALSLQYVQELFIDNYDPTIQDNYRKNIHLQDKFYDLDILDTAGQDEFTTLRSQYMKHYEAFLLVCSITSMSSLIELRKFSKEIFRSKCFPGESQPRHRIPCLIVINKIDLPQNLRQFDESNIKVIANELGFDYIFTSAKENQFVSNAFETICHMAIDSRRERIEMFNEAKGRSKPTGCKCSLM